MTLAVGTKDRAVPPEGTRALVGRFPDARIVEFQGLGHLMHEEEPERFAEVIGEAALA